MKTLLSSLLLAPLLLARPAFADTPYCLAVRGNGENVAAHWSAVARLVEENGLPVATAGGSSGAVTLFFLDRLAANPALKAEKNPQRRRRAAGLLLKSLPEFTTVMAETDGLLDAYAFFRELKDAHSSLFGRFTKALGEAGALGDPEFRRVFAKYLPLVNPELLRLLSGGNSFFRDEARASLRVFGKFEAKGDRNLFFRPGVADFSYFALLLGTIADFYAGEAGADVNAGLAAFVDACADATYGKAWKDGGTCREQFRRLAQDYLAKGKFPQASVFRSVGEAIPSYPSTAILEGAAAAEYGRLWSRYEAADASAAYPDFHAATPADLRFGYWGDPARLAAIDAQLEPARRVGDEKARRFLSLGAANWFEVLSASPAEPGLARLQSLFTDTSRAAVLNELPKPFGERWRSLRRRDGLLSAGGWSDLHPTGFLRAAGCKNIVYLTRKGGDAIFSQEIFVRLAGEEKQVTFWDHLSDENDRGWDVTGTPAARTAWNRLYNLANPTSAFNRALAASDAVYCTDWNRFKVFGGEMPAMTDEAYAAPVFLRAGAPASLAVNPAPSDPRNFPGCQPLPAARAPGSLRKPRASRP